MLISIIIPFFNVEKFLEEAIESILAQSYTDWELLLVDDGSTDGSVEIAKSYVRSHGPKIKYLMHENHQNNGLTASRNLALKHAKGAYVALLDGDDFWFSEKLLIQVNIAKAHPECSLIGTAALYWYSWKNSSDEDVERKVGGVNDQKVEPPRFAIDLYPLGNGDAPCPSTLMIKTDVLRYHNGFVEKFAGIYQMYEDQAFLAKFYLNEVCFMSSFPLIKYRQRPSSLVSSVMENGQYEEVRFFFLKWLKKYINENGINDKKLVSVIKRALITARYPILLKVKSKTLRIFNKIKKARK